VTTTAAGAAIFDMDGVLIDSGAHHRDAWDLLLRELGREPAPESWRVTIGRPAEEAVGLLLGRRLEADEARSLARRKRAHYALLAERGMLPIRGVAGFVDQLVRRGVPRAVATSATRGDLDALLSQVGLRGHFEVIVTAEDVRWGKPNPEVFLRAAAGLEVPPTTCLVFEDSLVGVHAARNAGMRVIGLTTAHDGRELLAAGAERAIADFEGFTWPE
jgi:HAD superfamily hydrolase (TIGR01509 family)